MSRKSIKILRNEAAVTNDAIPASKVTRKIKKKSPIPPIEEEITDVPQLLVEETTTDINDEELANNDDVIGRLVVGNHNSPITKSSVGVGMKLNGTSPKAKTKGSYGAGISTNRIWLHSR